MHTKGPWEVVEGKSGKLTIRNTSTTAIMTEPIAADQRGAIIATVQYLFARQDSVERARANAQLIAAAPELLEALEALACNAIKTDDLADSAPLYIPCTAGELRSARAAIAKAKGTE